MGFFCGRLNLDLSGLMRLKGSFDDFLSTPDNPLKSSLHRFLRGFRQLF
jgi:hypothetical protein